MMPAPTHLEGIIKRLSDEDIKIFNLEKRYAKDIKDGLEFSFIGKVTCTCGNESMIFLQPNDEIGSSYLKAKCPSCSKEYLLFDIDFHGWDGWICHDEKAGSSERPALEVYKCKDCLNEAHEIVLIIDSQGKEDFITEAGEDYDLNRWQDAFEWITIDIKCSKCGAVTKEIVSCETM